MLGTAAEIALKKISKQLIRQNHGLRTHNEGINQRNLKFWAKGQTKYASAVPKNLGLGFDFWPCSEGDFLTGRP